MQRLQSRTSSFDERLWDELEAQARRRRSNEGRFDRGPASRDIPYNAASPFARQLDKQGAPTLFGQPSRPDLPMPHRPSAVEQAAPPAVPETMASPFSAAAQPKGSLAAEQGVLAQATDAHVDVGLGPLPSGNQQSSRGVASLKEEKVNATAGLEMQPPQGKHGNNPEMALDAPENVDRPSTHHHSSLGAGAAFAARGKTGLKVEPPSEDPMGIAELAVCSERPKRMPVQPHRLAEVVAALDAKSSSRPSSFSTTAPSHQDQSSQAPERNAECAGFPKAVSEGGGGRQTTMSTLMGVGAVSQSVPELTHQAASSGMSARLTADFLFMHNVEHLLHGRAQSSSYLWSNTPSCTPSLFMRVGFGGALMTQYAIPALTFDRLGLQWLS